MMNRYTEALSKERYLEVRKEYFADEGDYPHYSISKANYIKGIVNEAF